MAPHSIQHSESTRITGPLPESFKILRPEERSAYERDGFVALTGVVDKDWIASYLAVRLQAETLIFATDVEYVFENFGQINQTALPKLTIPAAEKLLEGDEIQDGSIAPKLASALDYVCKTGRSARICYLQKIIEALRGDSGTLLAGAI